MLRRSRSARHIACVLLSGWALPALADGGDAGIGGAWTAVVIVVGALSALIVPLNPPSRFVTRAPARAKAHRSGRDR